MAFAGLVDPHLSNASPSLPHSLEIQAPESQVEVSLLQEPTQAHTAESSVPASIVPQELSVEVELPLQQQTMWNAHGVLWKQKDVNAPIGGRIPRRYWQMRTFGGDSITEGDDAGPARSRRTTIDYFMASFPHVHLLEIVRVTSDKLQRKQKRGLSTGELLKFFGVLVLGTRYKFGRRAELWATEAGNHLLQAPCFRSRTGMSRNRFDDIFSSLSFSKQGPRAVGETSTEHR